jgi:hypothetical protein
MYYGTLLWHICPLHFFVLKQTATNCSGYDPVRHRSNGKQRPEDAQADAMALLTLKREPSLCYSSFTRDVPR